MNESSRSTERETRRQSDAGNLEVAHQLFSALFAEEDTTLIRPIESWSEGTKRRSMVIHNKVAYPRGSDLRRRTLVRIIDASDADRSNVYFGVCPRVGDQGKYDLAWQIRTVRTLWADIDNTSVEDALERVKAAPLPEPSIVVNSGNGVHLYWLLDQAFLIDDAGDPPPVLTRFVEVDGKPKSEKYFIDAQGHEVLVRHRHLCPKLSPKAEHIQDILGGIAAKIGGDHTTDLSRLLRVPGTLNRKDQRNGKEPKPTVLVTCEPRRRYPLSAFENLATEAPSVVRREQLKQVRLPTPKKLSATQQDLLNAAITRSAVEPKGSRSEADFGLCCIAIEKGVAQAELWRQVADIGKFKECGQDYFDRTWEAAAERARGAILDKVQQKPESKGGKRRAQRADGIEPHDDGLDPHDGNDEPAHEDGSGCEQKDNVIIVDPQTTEVGTTMICITTHLLTARTCFNRADQLVAIFDDQIEAILTPAELAGLCNKYVEFQFIGEKFDEYKPLPTNYANTWLKHPTQRRSLPAIKLFTRNPVYTADWRLVLPGYDAASGIYYGGPAVEPRQGTEHLDTLLRDFCFQTPGDRTNYIGLLLTALLVPQFVGSKPAALFNGNQPELGKSILAQIIAILRDGQFAETATYNPNDEEFEKRLGAIVRRGVTTIIIDNAKSHGRNPRIESACLERSITDPILSYRLLGQSATIRAENSHIFCITANTPDVSRDLVTRSVVINLYFEGEPKRRVFSLADPEGYAQQYRFELLGELIGMVERWKAAGRPMAKTHSRFNKRSWGNVVGGILEACGEPDFLANAEEAAAQLDETRRDFTELVEVLVDHPQGAWTASELVELCAKYGLMAADLGEGTPRSLATRMGTLAGRFIEEQFPLPDGRAATFHRAESRKGNVYKVSVAEDSAEP